MSKQSFDTISVLQPGRYDYKIKVRVIKKWRGATRTGEVFKGFNILLIDNMKTRIHAFIPGFCVDNLEDKITIGKVCAIKNFTVQNYKETDIYRCIRHDKQLIFSKDTKIYETEEKGTGIPYETFDFYDHGELRTVADQKTYLTDVVGIIKKTDFRDLKNSQGKMQKQGKLTITDGSSNVNCTFWDEFARNLEENLNHQVDKPVIIIISCARVALWNEQVEISNVAPTTFYLNYKHHSVLQLRRKLNEPQFAEKALNVQNFSKKELLTVDQIVKLGKEYIQSQVFTHVKINSVEETPKWFITICTTCESETELKNGLMMCTNCPRVVPHPDKKYKVNVAASDNTGGIDIILTDREVRTLIGKRARNLFDEMKTNNKFPQPLKDISKKDYTVGIRIREINVVDHYQVYWATNICNGFVKVEDDNTLETSTSQPTSSTYQVQGLSDFNSNST